MNTQELNNVLSCLVSNCSKLKEVCETWGDQHMLTIAMEENAEMIQAVSKIKRNGPNLDNSSHLNEEVADVLNFYREDCGKMDDLQELNNKLVKSCKKANRDFFILVAAYVATLMLMIYLFIR